MNGVNSDALTFHTSSGIRVPNNGYGHLAAALDEAWEVSGTNRAEIEMAGDRPGGWTIVLGGHVDSQSVIHFGAGLLIRPDATVVGRKGDIVEWLDSQTMDDGGRRDRFLVGGVATSVSWRNARQDRLAQMRALRDNAAR